MDPSAEQVTAFGADARLRRRAAGLSAQAVADSLTNQLGRTISRQSVEAWERGEYGPRDQATASALDAVLSANGELMALLVTENAGTLEDRIARLESQMAEAMELLRGLGTPRGARATGE